MTTHRSRTAGTRSRRRPPGLLDICAICHSNLTTWADRSKPPGVEFRWTPTADQGMHYYRLRVLGGTGEREFPAGGYRAGQGTFVYHLCGAGHVFYVRTELETGSVAATAGDSQIEMVAILGSAAAGKSYLTVRTLSQLLIGAADRGATTIQDRALAPFEDIPFALLEAEYQDMLGSGKTLEATRTDYMRPRDFLPRIDVSLSAEIAELLRAETEFEFGEWHSRIRQPVVRKYRVGDAEVTMAVADLSGEIFATAGSNTGFGGAGNQELTIRLFADFDTLIWAVDPAVVPHFDTWARLPDDTILASTRPEDNPRDLPKRQAGREGAQRATARILADQSVVDNETGWPQRLFVAVTKSDLIEKALRSEDTRLDGLDEQDSVRDGIIRYLAYAADRVAAGRWTLSPEASALFRELDPGGEPIREQRLLRFANALIDHFSGSRNFWALVHGGAATTIAVPEPETESADHPEFSVRLPSLQEHLRAVLHRSGSGALHLRELVLSALGCGIACGLQSEVVQLLTQDRRELFFVLCSPFGGLPTLRPAQTSTIEPADTSKRFPSVTALSAGLAHLHIHLLRRHLP